MKISFVATVFNEEKTINVLLDSIFKQTKMPDEIIIVDGGSSDYTVAKIKNEKLKMKKYLAKPDLASQDRSKVKIFIRTSITIAQGRNYGIRNSIGDIIVMTDGGCMAHKDWLEKITRPFEEENADIVAGFYRMIGSTPLQRALSVFLGIPPEKFDKKNFLPSARSMAFKKSLWERIGGFSEQLERAGEDTLFNYQAIKRGAKFVRVKDALVDWDVPDSLWEGIKKFYAYAKGDVQAGIWWHPTQRVSTHNLKIASIFIRYLTGAILVIVSISYNWLWYVVLFGFLFYILWSVWKMRDVVIDIRTRLWLPIVQITSDIAVLLGTSWGILRRH